MNSQDVQKKLKNMKIKLKWTIKVSISKLYYIISCATSFRVKLGRTNTDLKININTFCIESKVQESDNKLYN